MTLNQPTSTAVFAATVESSVSGHGDLFLAEGIILVLLGLVATMVPPLAEHATTIILALVFLASGATGLYSTFGAKQVPGFGWSLLSAVVAVLAGGVLLWDPWQGPATLTYGLVAFFNVNGLLIMMLGLQHRVELTPRWEWMMIRGAIDALLSAIIIAGLLDTLVWPLGFLVGIDLVWGGASLIGMALAASKLVVDLLPRQPARRMAA